MDTRDLTFEHLKATVKMAILNGEPLNIQPIPDVGSKWISGFLRGATTVLHVWTNALGTHVTHEYSDGSVATRGLGDFLEKYTPYKPLPKRGDKVRRNDRWAVERDFEVVDVRKQGRDTVVAIFNEACGYASHSLSTFEELFSTIQEAH